MRTALLLVLTAALLTPNPASANDPKDFLRLLGGETADREAALGRIRADWHPGSSVMLLEVLNFVRDPRISRQALDLLESKTSQEFGFDVKSWYEYLWSQEENPHPQYAEFKSLLYRIIDPKFAGYFSQDRKLRIRLDEVRWGGVTQDGIPPLRSPKMISAKEAKYLDDSNIVFAIEVEGDARAYPKRILAWHEMFVDEVGGVPVAGVYCTLCGTVILFDTEVDGVNHAFGTSGFLYRSNKLMYDAATQSLWYSIWGEPVIGPLADSGIQLNRRSVVTTTWGEWRKRHPKTQVLSLDTGHERDYGEGVAYNSYFATDELMFNTPFRDSRLKNKDEVLGLVFPETPQETLAISQAFLVETPVYHDAIGPLDFVVLTDRSGGNRVYATEGLRFAKWDQKETVTDSTGARWKLTESALEGPEGQTLTRLPSQRVFWFGWLGSYPQTRLVRLPPADTVGQIND